MARRELEPKTPIAARLREIRRVLGDIDRFVMADRLGVSKSTLSYYERGESEPTASVLAAYRMHYGVNVDWVLTGQGAMFLGGEISMDGVSYADVRRYAWNIAEHFWKELPRRTKPDLVADQFIENLDFLVSRSELKEDAASEVIQFGAERLKRTSGAGEP